MSAFGKGDVKQQSHISLLYESISYIPNVLDECIIPVATPAEAPSTLIVV